MKNITKSFNYLMYIGTSFLGICCIIWATGSQYDLPISPPVLNKLAVLALLLILIGLLGNKLSFKQSSNLTKIVRILSYLALLLATLLFLGLLIWGIILGESLKNLSQ